MSLEDGRKLTLDIGSTKWSLRVVKLKYVACGIREKFEFHETKRYLTVSFCECADFWSSRFVVQGCSDIGLLDGGVGQVIAIFIGPRGDKCAEREKAE